LLEDWNKGILKLKGIISGYNYFYTYEFCEEYNIVIEGHDCRHGQGFILMGFWFRAGIKHTNSSIVILLQMRFQLSYLGY